MDGFLLTSEPTKLCQPGKEGGASLHSIVYAKLRRIIVQIMSPQLDVVVLCEAFFFPSQLKVPPFQRLVSRLMESDEKLLFLLHSCCLVSVLDSPTVISPNKRITSSTCLFLLARDEFHLFTFLIYLFVCFEYFSSKFYSVF